MRKQFSKFAQVAILGFALTFTLSCSDDDGDEGGGSSSSITGGLSSPSGGGSNSSQCSSLPSGIKGKSGTFVDDRDSITYKWVEIGEQIWMAENLNYRGTEPDTLGKCYNNEPDKCEVYGRLYNWATAMALPASCNGSTCASQVEANHKGICPTGWHIPSNADWVILMKFVNPNCSDIAGGICECAGTKLESASGWNYSGYMSPPGSDDYGFSALPGGAGNAGIHDFDLVGSQGYWWSSYEMDRGDYAHIRDMGALGDYVGWASYLKACLFSVRCVKDD